MRIRKIKFTEPFPVLGNLIYARYAFVFIRGLTRAGWSDFKNICGAIVGKSRDDKDLLFPDRKHIKDRMVSCMLNIRTGIRGHRGYFKIIKWEDFDY